MSAESSTDVPRMSENWKVAHGRAGCKQWPKPRLVVRSSLSVRPDQKNDINANEYLDDPEVLDAKLDLFVALLQASKCAVAYTGAGLSKASGIPDYASKAANSIASTFKTIQDPTQARPTLAHRVLTALAIKKQILKYWVQQNHDGLPQKAGFPEWLVNSIHGDWFDISNPVVQFSGSLRSDLFAEMLEMEEKQDLCICLGTSLSGMNADRMAVTPTKKCDLPKPAADVALDAEQLATATNFGTILVNLQRTHLDEKTTLRIWAKLDDVFAGIAKKLNLAEDAYAAPPVPLPLPSTTTPDVYALPRYDGDGLRLPHGSPDSNTVIDLRPGRRVRVAVPEASNVDMRATVHGVDDEGNFVFSMRREGKLARSYLLGRWWIAAAMQGKVKRFPIVNDD